MRQFVASRWQGRVTPSSLLWRDMIAVGTLVNLLATFAALMTAARADAPGMAVLLHLAPLPYNVFLFLCLWRAACRTRAQIAMGLAWLVVVTAV